jgi:predicted transcriptional regulator
MTDIQTAIYDITQLELKAQQEIAALRNDISLSQRDVAQKNAVASEYLTQIADKIKVCPWESCLIFFFVC